MFSTIFEVFLPITLKVIKLHFRNLVTFPKGPVKLIKRVKIAHLFLQSVSDQFHVINLGLPI